MTNYERFFSHVDFTDNCWIWIGAKKAGGYGSFWNGNKNVGAHRWSYETLIGPIPPGLTLDHLCREPACVNPDHLEPVTNRVNLMRGIGIPAINAKKTHCPSGHEYTEANTNRHGGTRHCRKCNNRESKERRLRRKEARLRGEGK